MQLLVLSFEDVSHNSSFPTDATRVLCYGNWCSWCKVFVWIRYQCWSWDSSSRSNLRSPVVTPCHNGYGKTKRCCLSVLYIDMYIVLNQALMGPTEDITPTVRNFSHRSVTTGHSCWSGHAVILNMWYGWQHCQNRQSDTSPISGTCINYEWYTMVKGLILT